jgi:hypothetical protein
VFWGPGASANIVLFSVSLFVLHCFDNMLTQTDLTYVTRAARLAQVA